MYVEATSTGSSRLLSTFQNQTFLSAFSHSVQVPKWHPLESIPHQVQSTTFNMAEADEEQRIEAAKEEVRFKTSC
jgi:hypothetical protein